MGFFRKLLGKNDAIPAPAPLPVSTGPVPAAGKISYDPKLVESLLRDHAELGRVFGNVGDALQQGKFDEIRSLLVQFKSRLEAHVLTENVRFYNYLEQSLSSDLNNTSVMHDFRREMNSIARSVIEFVKKYQSSTFTPGERHQFSMDYETVGKILEQRLDNEENNLYPLYQPG